jgi:hypothetical protein
LPTDARRPGLLGPLLSARPARTRLGGALTAVACALLATWFAWRITSIGAHPLEIVFFAAEVVGVVGGTIISFGLARAGERRHVYEHEPADSHWFAVAIADIVGRTRMVDLHREVRSALRGSPLWPPRNRADATIAALLWEGPRRLAVVLTVSIGLLLGVSPVPAPPWWAIATAASGYACLAVSHVILGRGRLRLGDRTRWSFGAIGEVVARTDVAGHAPRRWIGAMAVAVGVSLAVALRGMSDRWTHGLESMHYDDRVTALVLAASLVLGALYTINTTPGPDPVDPHLAVRRLDESSVRQSLLFAAVVIGLIGLFAGVVPGAGTDIDDSVVAPVVSDGSGVVVDD